MRSTAGETVSKGASGDVVRLNIDGETYFLKRRQDGPLMAMIVMALHGRRPMGRAMREVRMLEQLGANGFAVMATVACGEKRAWGQPRGGFLLARAVPGELAADLYRNSGQEARCELMEDIGRLTGKLHAAGYFDHVRLKDLMVGDDGSLTLIDRECRHPWAKRFTRRHALRSIARTARRTLRDGMYFTPSALRAYFAGYRGGVSSRWQVSRGEFRKQVFREIRRELAG